MTFKTPHETWIEGWRKRREKLAPPSKPTYDAYPGDYPPPEMRFYVESRDAKGRLLREYVDMEGYSITQINWAVRAMRGGVPTRDWFVGQMLAAVVRLSIRVEAARVIIDVRKQP